MLKNIRTALLSTGKGPLAKATFDYLSNNSNLQLIAISKKPSSRKKEIKYALREYGIWYCLQVLISLIIRKLLNYNVNNIFVAKKIEVDSNNLSFITKEIKEKNIEKVFICGFHYIINQSFLSEWPLTYNIHPSLLPAYRGPEPIIWGLIEKKHEFGITLHIVDKGLDTGPIVAQKKVEAPKILLASLVELRLSKEIPYLFSQLNSPHNQINQDESKASYRPFATIKNRKTYEAT